MCFSLWETIQRHGQDYEYDLRFKIRYVLTCYLSMSADMIRNMTVLPWKEEVLHYFLYQTGSYVTHSKKYLYCVFLSIK